MFITKIFQIISWKIEGQLEKNEGFEYAHLP